jgi:hypothetical protein
MLLNMKYQFMEQDTSESAWVRHRRMGYCFAPTLACQEPNLENEVRQLPEEEVPINHCRTS